MSGAVSRSLVCAALIGSAVGVAAGADRSLSLREAVTMALEKNEGLIVAREELSAAQAWEDGARGAYDPRLGLQLGWMRTTQAANSAFSGAPVGEVAPTDTSGELGLGLRQLLPTGGEVRFRAAAARQSTDGSFALLSPAHRTQLGLEIRQPLLRNLATDPARLGLFGRRGGPGARRSSSLVRVTQRDRGRGRAGVLAAGRRPPREVDRAARRRCAWPRSSSPRPESASRAGARPRPRSPSRAPSSSGGAASCWRRARRWRAPRTRSSC